MKITTVLFDLDGTLLPMDQDEFTKKYFKLLAAKIIPFGYDPEEIVNGIWAGTAAMVKNDGSRTNEEAFWERFAQTCGDKVLCDKALFEDFYANDFNRARQFCGFNEKSKQTVEYLKSKGIRVALATNPIFPLTATENRIEWAGCSPDDFEIYTTYENSRFCKPDPSYFKEVAEKLGTAPGECLMVGNDVEEDMIAETVGMKVFLLTDCMINKKNRDISVYPHGGFSELLTYIDKLID